ncbi:VMAP-related conflict system protein [Streptomyces sp. NPDC054847]
MDALGSFLTLVGQFVVRVRGDGIRGGTGFLAAPGRVLTCAHVVSPPGAGSGSVRTADRVRVQWAGGDYDGTVRAEPAEHRGERLWRYPDLAVITLPEPPRGHSWLPLSDAVPALGSRLYAAGFSAVYERGSPQLGGATVEFESPHTYDGHEMLKVKGGELAPGMSGGPLLDPSLGRVVGLVTTTRKDGWDLGGLALPASAVRDRFPDVWADNQHADRPDDHLWDLVTELRHESAHRRLLSHAERRALVAAAAGLGMDPNALYWQAVGRLGRAPDKPLEDFAALVRECADAQPAQLGAVHPLVRLVELIRAEQARGSRGDQARIAPAETTGDPDRIRDLPAAIASRLGQPYTPLEEAVGSQPVRGPRYSSIEVRLSPLGSNRRRYLLSMWKRTDTIGDSVPVLCLDKGLTFSQARDHVRKMLPETVAQMREYAENLVIEFALPTPLLAKAMVDEWDLGNAWAPLGTMFVVVLRASDRAPVTHGNWVSRWRRLQSGAHEDVAIVDWVDCHDDSDIGEMFATLMSTESLSVLGISYQPDSGTAKLALEAALYAGVPAAIWPRTSCPEHSGDGAGHRGAGSPPGGGRPGGMCAGDRFQRSVAQQMSGQPLSDLPRLVKKLRIDARTRGQDPDHCGRALTLLWDDPTRAAPDAGAPALAGPSDGATAQPPAEPRTPRRPGKGEQRW